MPATNEHQVLSQALAIGSIAKEGGRGATTTAVVQS